MKFPTILLVINGLAVLSLIAVISSGMFGNATALRTWMRTPQAGAVEQNNIVAPNASALTNLGNVCAFGLACMRIGH